jgi:hypothetical protein
MRVSGHSGKNPTMQPIDLRHAYAGTLQVFRLRVTLEWSALQTKRFRCVFRDQNLVRADIRSASIRGRCAHLLRQLRMNRGEIPGATPKAHQLTSPGTSPRFGRISVLYNQLAQPDLWGSASIAIWHNSCCRVSGTSAIMSDIFGASAGRRRRFGRFGRFGSFRARRFGLSSTVEKPV